MNNLMIIVFIAIMWTINAKVDVISVNMPLLASNHANELTRVINLKEKQGCLLFNVESYNSATYLYFRCSE
jgi:hypothetical protein